MNSEELVELRKVHEANLAKAKTAEDKTYYGNILANLDRVIAQHLEDEEKARMAKLPT